MLDVGSGSGLVGIAAMMSGHDEASAPKTLDTMSLDEIIAHRSRHLTAYQNAKLAARYQALVKQVRDAARDRGFGDELPRAVAINYAKLLAYKDEYEVARLYTDGRFERQLRDQFDGDFKISFNLAPPLLGGAKDALGRPKKRAFGAWMLPAFRLLAKMRVLRGTPFDIFGYSPDRRLERDLIAGYEKDVAHILSVLSPLTLETAIEILSLPDRIRGYGPVKEKAVNDAKARYDQLAADLQRAVTGGFEPLVAEVLGVPQNADAGAEALLRVRPLTQDDLDERRGLGADLPGLPLDALRCPVGVTPVTRRHVLAHRRVLSVR